MTGEESIIVEYIRDTRRARKRIEELELELTKDQNRLSKKWQELKNDGSDWLDFRRACQKYSDEREKR